MPFKRRRHNNINRSIDEGTPNHLLSLDNTFRNTSLLGSSQINGCQGDFCDYDLDFFQSNGISFDDIIKSGESNKKKNASMKCNHSSMSSLLIPSKIVYQARQEMPLVKRFLDKYQRGEIVENIEFKNYNDLEIGVKLPSHYYSEFRCCSECYEVYKIIGHARDSAIRKISNKTIERRIEGNEIKYNHSDRLQKITDVVNSLSKLDIAEIRTMINPPAAVEVVIEAVMCILFGKVFTFDESKKIFGSGDQFIQILREFRAEDVTDETLRLVEPYTDNPIFRPENVLSVSYSSSKFCSWVLGVVQASKWQRGYGHLRSNILPASSTPHFANVSKHLKSKKLHLNKHKNEKVYESTTSDDISFVEKLKRRNERKVEQDNGSNHFSRAKFLLTENMKTKNTFPKTILESLSFDNMKKTSSKAQKIAIDRLSSHDKMEGNSTLSGNSKEFRSSDGLTKMPYVVLGSASLISRVSNFIIFHDFFDTCDATALMCKPLIKRHDGSQILCFNYPGQAHTIWPRLSVVEKERGAKEPTLHCEWICDKVHELVEYALISGDLSLSAPFHIVGIGYGACIASYFFQKWGDHQHYSNLRSLVLINGFLYPDPQLSSILHSASHIFESSPHSRPDISLSYWASFTLSEDYLSKVNPNLALNLSTAVTNPITNEGRCKIIHGCLEYGDIYRKDYVNFHDKKQREKKIPIILIQSTENKIINPTNVDPFLVGRNTRHLWSHQLNYLSSDVLRQALDSNANWVGKLSSGPSDYQKFSFLGKNGLRMLLDTLSNPSGAFVMWVRSGHNILQENKTCFLDLLDVLAYPYEEHVGFDHSNEVGVKTIVVDNINPKMELLFHTKSPNIELAINGDGDEETVMTENVLQNIIHDVFVVENKDVDPQNKIILNDDNIVVMYNNLSHADEVPLSKSFNAVDIVSSPKLIKNIHEVIDIKNDPTNLIITNPTHFPESSRDQKEKRSWTDRTPNVKSIIELEEILECRMHEFEFISKDLSNVISSEKAAFRDDTYHQRQENDNDQLLIKLKDELEVRQIERAVINKQSRLELQYLGEIVENDYTMQQHVPIKELPPLHYTEPMELPSDVVQLQNSNLSDQFDNMLHNEEIARKKGIMSLEAYEVVKSQMLVKQIDRDNKLRNLASHEQETLLIESICTLQRISRGYIGRCKAHVAAAHRRLRQKIVSAVIKIQSVIRGFIGKRRFEIKLKLHLLLLKRSESIILIQSVIRGCLSRKYVKKLKYKKTVVTIQRFFRGYLGRIAIKRERNRLYLLHKKYQSASIIQSAWRMKVAKEEFRSLRIHMLASIEIQRCYRGYLGRKQMSRRRIWESTAPGPDRIKLGMKVIEESKLAFEKQQEEIDALHRAQERAEARVSHIHAELKDAEKELSVLERELQEIDQIERDLQILTHEKELLRQNVKNAIGLPRTSLNGHEDIILGKESISINDPDLERRRKAEAYALEMTLQIKRAEREKKKQELETEFASVFKEVDKKRKALERLEISLADMESTRERKDREFRRLQSNLMQLLLEQKQELDDLREKGIELETATATTAAAANATAQKAKEHEIRSNAMFSQTEELMKFQFMSMSLSYFSSLNMLKQLRDMNTDTTTAAVTSSADAAASAAAAAAAANLPNIKEMTLGANDFIELSIQKKKAELEISDNAEIEAKKSKANPFPENVKTWTISDVCRWLDTIYLGQYVSIFKEACIDGPFLLELREEDFVQVLGMRHKLHVRKILIFREKLKPLSKQDSKNKVIVELEESAKYQRNNAGVPTLDSVFSQARNGRIKRVEESLNLGFKVDTEDERGNTLLLVAAQNSNKKLVEILLVRGANINHQNAQGNTSLHFALAFDSEGMIGEYLIEHGADDTIENVEGLTPYDGIV